MQSPGLLQAVFSTVLVGSLALVLQPAGVIGQDKPSTPPASSGPSGGDLMAGSTPLKTEKFADLSVRYRFSERYSTDETRLGPGIVGAYRVAILESIRDSAESSQGAPKRNDSTFQTIYAERPAEMGVGVGNVASTVRVIEKHQVKGSQGSSSPSLEGATILIRPRSNQLPLLLSLSEGKPLTESDYDLLSGQVFVPQLALLFPNQSVRLGDTWRISRRATQNLLGDPSIQAETLVAKLTEIRKEVAGPRMVASISITGKVPGADGEISLNALVLFTFQGSLPIKDRPKKAGELIPLIDDSMDARGAITELRLASITSGPQVKGGRLRFQTNRELTMHRQLGLIEGVTPPPVLTSIPDLTEANTWLTHVDRSGRYTLRHPQELLAPERSLATAEPNTTLLVRTGRNGRDMIQIEFVSKTLTPEDLKKKLAEKCALLKMEVLQGQETWLPEADWPRMRVHRIDAALKVRDSRTPGVGETTRVHFDAYLLQFSQDASILALASTSKEAVAPFREEVEKILKTVELDPIKK